MSEDTKQILAEIASSTIEIAKIPLPPIEEVAYTYSNSFVESVQNSTKELPSDYESPLQDTCSIFSAAAVTTDTILTKVAIGDTVIIIQDPDQKKKSSCALFFEKIINAIKRIFKH